MVKKSISVLILLNVLLSSCALQPTAEGRYQLGRPFRDFYDTAFILTNAGRTPPRELNLAQAADLLAGYDVVFFGENHGHPGVHLQEMKLLRALHERNPRWVVSFEQFERDVQDVVDDYLAGRIGETTLIAKARAWNNYAASYRPLLIYAREQHLPVVAAEAPGWAISCVGQWGVPILEQFTPLERSFVARNVEVQAGAYRDKYMSFLSGSPTHGGAAHGGAAHGGTSTPGGAADAADAAGAAGAAAKAERSFSAQVARDDTMAESIDDALRRHPGYHLLHLTGSFHAAGFLGTVERLRQLNPRLNVAVIDPVEVADTEKPGFGPEDAGGGTLLQLIYPNPEALADGEDMSAMMATMTHEREMNRCRYSPPTAPPPQN
jgi:uncharacterized iron-regulated protein